jgi:hypothetical protein
MEKRAPLSNIAAGLVYRAEGAMPDAIHYRSDRACLAVDIQGRWCGA